ncbi:Cytokinin dehydrogenase 3 [Sesamum alatum]|uniref:cytokinin dehydrogenase n=1 Tax=Sesamum alatum TaxID=300844 RepID=A0AAE1XPI6_9LAMI|nr:Cytokinin dehydrogenase 3 [Sesamum alatum]
MANPCLISAHFAVLIIILSCISIFSFTSPLPNDIVSLDLATRLRHDPHSINIASNDYGNLVRESPSAVLHPSSIDDIVNLIKFSNNCSTPFGISARGRGHSVRGQTTARGGVVVHMPSLSENGIGIRVSWDPSLGYYADVGGEQMWIDVLRAGLDHGLAPVSWTDYLYLSVGGTLSNAGISGQSFLHGPQISNVLELDVITGKGKFITCSRDKNPELFFGVLGGLGQFGIITRARIILEKAPTRVKWVRLIYSNFSTFTRDQEHLISINSPNYVEGILITNENTTNQWRSSFSSPSNQSDIVALLKKQGILYSIELVKYYDNQTASTIDKDFETLLKELNFIPGLIFSADTSLFDFLNRVGDLDSPTGPLEAHPWLNLFIPKSQISDFNAGVLASLFPKLNEPSGIFLFYPLNRKKWDDRTSVVIPEEDVFYTLGVLHSSPPNAYQIYDEFNSQILGFCEKVGIKVKQYLPNYKSQAEWIKHFGPKWPTFRQRKSTFDPKFILSPGQRIFNSA